MGGVVTEGDVCVWEIGEKVRGFVSTETCAEDNDAIRIDLTNS